MNPFDYGLCRQTVTIYRKLGETIHRQVAENCCLSVQNSLATEHYGKSRLKKFLLIIPGDHPLQPGDRIYDGIGPDVVQWQNFLPALVSQLYEVSFAKPCSWEGEVTHWEAGCRKETL